MDLGCGAGLLGIAALKHGANVVFQDYVSGKSNILVSTKTSVT